MTDTLPTDTTLEQDRHSLGQRRINLLWEVTQGVIAVAVTGATIYAAVSGDVKEVLSNAFFLIIGFYFGRTNHQRVGGVSLGR